MDKIRYRLTYNYSNRLNADGRSQVAIEARQGLSKAYFKTNVLLFPNQWNKGKVINHPNSTKLTVYLIKHLHSIEEIELDSLLSGKEMSLSQLKTAVRKGIHKGASLRDFMTAVIDTDSSRCKNTKNSYHYLVNEMEKEYGKINISDIDYDLIIRWRESMRKKKLSENTIKGRLKALRCLMEQARKRDLIDKNPFEFITIGNMTPRVEALTLSEIRKFENAKLEGREAVVRDFCLLSAYSGLRFSDLSTLEDATIKNGILKKRMCKTKLDVTIPIGTLFYGKGLEIINRYQPITKLSHCVRCNSTLNRIIKDIAKRIGVKKNVHCHLFRKSCSTLLYEMGMPVQEISMVLGHSKIETTLKHYIFNKEKSLIKSSRKLFKAHT